MTDAVVETGVPGPQVDGDGAGSVFATAVEAHAALGSPAWLSPTDLAVMSPMAVVEQVLMPRRMLARWVEAARRQGLAAAG